MAINEHYSLATHMEEQSAAMTLYELYPHTIKSKTLKRE